MEENVRLPFWQKTWFIVLLLFLFPPAGIVLMWVSRKFNNPIRIVLSILGILWTIIAFLIGTPSKANEPINHDSVNITSSAQSNESSLNNANPAVDAEKSKRVDEIIRQAKDDALSIDDSKKNTAAYFIRDNYPAYFKDLETMEQTIYYGALLEYAYSSDPSMYDYANLGLDAKQSVKYVYIGTESILDDSVSSNLSQIKENLEKIAN